MSDTPKDELLLGGGIRHLTATSQQSHRFEIYGSASQYQAHRKQATYVSNIVWMR